MTVYLKKIRQQQGLPEYSGLTPAEVIDYFVNHRLLYQYKFVGVTGGNILNPVHLNNLMSLLQGEQGITSHLKAAATFYFREHVISILKCNDDAYDVVQSMAMLGIDQGSRTRCFGLDALHLHLSHYCLQHFSDENINFIETNPWEDERAVSDPRLFQGFVWADLLRHDTVDDM